MKPLWYRCWHWLCARTYYERIAVVHPERLPTAGPTATTDPLAVVATPAPQLSVGGLKDRQLVQTKIGEATIIACINNSWNNYGAYGVFSKCKVLPKSAFH
jgi:hypothetical protein